MRRRRQYGSSHFIGACISASIVATGAERLLAGPPRPARPAHGPGSRGDHRYCRPGPGQRDRPHARPRLLRPPQRLREQPLPTDLEPPRRRTLTAAVVRALLDAGADVGARDARFDRTPLAAATVGSGERARQPGDWTGTVRLLIEAGASRHSAWITGKPPIEEIIDLLQRYGITRDGPVDPEAEDGAQVPGPILASWPTSPASSRPPTATRTLACSPRSCTRGCSGPACAATREQVLDWYRRQLAGAPETCLRNGGAATVSGHEPYLSAATAGGTRRRPGQ